MAQEEKLQKARENLRYMEESAKQQAQTEPQKINITNVAEDVISVLNKYGIKIKDINAVFEQVNFIISERVIPIRGDK